MKRKTLLSLWLVMILLSGLPFPTSGAAAERVEKGEKGVPFPSYGTGPVEVRFYSDYFCPPCQAIEPEVEKLLASLLRKKAIRLSLVDTPLHAHTPLYARYFLFALKVNNDPEHALKVRYLLYEAAANDVTTVERLEALLKEKGIPLTSFETKPVFERYNLLLKEDKINSTPTLVVIKGGKKEKWVGGPDILKALGGLP